MVETAILQKLEQLPESLQITESLCTTRPPGGVSHFLL